MKKSPIFIVMFFVVLGLVTGTAVTQTADSMTGTWRVTIDFPPQRWAKILPFILQQDGEKIAGTLQARAVKVDVAGKIQGSDFELSYYAGGNITLNGKIEGNKISGTIEYPNGTKSPFTGEKK